MISPFFLILLPLGSFAHSDWEDLMIQPNRQEIAVTAGKPFYVSCSSQAKNVKRVMWRGPENNLITDHKGRVYVEDGSKGNTGMDLVFQNVSKLDRGTYTCSATINGVNKSKHFRLIVIQGIDFLGTPTIQYIEEGRDSRIECRVQGDPPPKVYWNFNNSRIRFGDKYLEAEGRNNNDILVKNATLRDGGLYMCKALQLSNYTSDVKDLKITVKVHHQPQWKKEQMNQTYSYVMGIANLTCEAVAEPHANFTWKKEDEVMTPSDTVEIFQEEHKSILQLTVTGDDMFGDYVCKVENHMGTLERVIILEKGAKPFPPEVKVKKADINNIELNISAPHVPEMPIVGYKVQYKVAGDNWNNAKVATFKKGQRYTINHLMQDTLYVFRAFSKNAAGYSESSDEYLQKTKKIEAQTVTGAAGAPYVSAVSISAMLALALLL